jgi:hypothetical protein
MTELPGRAFIGVYLRLSRHADETASMREVGLCTQHIVWAVVNEYRCRTPLVPLRTLHCTRQKRLKSSREDEGLVSVGAGEYSPLAGMPLES